MNLASGKWLRVRAPLFGALALGVFGGVVSGCSDSASSPDAVTVSELKYPGDLVIWDKGDGKVVLEWSGANNEEDFDGYNVYGMKGTAGTLGVTEGVALELLDDKGEKNPATDAILANFNYDPATTKLEAKGTAIALAETEDSDAPEFSYLPIHTGPADARLLPTCKPAAGTCTMTNAANQDATASNATYAVNGRVKFEVPETLKVGDSYCFFVLSSMDAGETVSQTTSNVQCVVPKYSIGFNLPIPAGADDPKHFDLRTYIAACEASTTGKCAAPAAPVLDAAADSTNNPTAAKSHTAADPMPIYIETSTTGAVGFVAGSKTAINDLGYYEKGFDDVTLPKGAPVLVLDDTTIGGTGVNADAPAFNGGGYSIAGQTVPLVAGHVYVFGVGSATATGAGPYFYHWLYVKSAPAGGNAAVEMRLTKKAI